MLERVVRWWSSLQSRERRVLGVGGTLVVLLLLYLVALEPAYLGRQRLQSELPALRAQVAQIEALAGEARRLTGQATQGAESAQQLRGQLEQSIAAAGLQGGVSQLTVAGELIDLRFRSVPFAGWLSWFDTALRETRLRAVDISIERETEPGVVSARLTLEAQKAAP